MRVSDDSNDLHQPVLRGLAENDWPHIGQGPGGTLLELSGGDSQITEDMDGVVA
jgi:hypothetical protein